MRRSRLRKKNLKSSAVHALWVKQNIDRGWCGAHNCWLLRILYKEKRNCARLNIQLTREIWWRWWWCKAINAVLGQGHEKSRVNSQLRFSASFVNNNVTRKSCVDFNVAWSAAKHILRLRDTTPHRARFQMFDFTCAREPDTPFMPIYLSIALQFQLAALSVSCDSHSQFCSE